MANPVKKLASRALRKPDDSAVERVEPAAFNPFPFFSFHYSFHEISSVGGKTHVRSHSTRLENGKLQTESFEGMAEGGAYDAMVSETQHRVTRQLASLFEQLWRFLPRGRV